MPKEVPQLSKSRFTAGLQCHRQLWWRVHEPDAPELIPSSSQQAIFDQGTRVGELARTYVPGGLFVDLPHHRIKQRIIKTRELLNSGIGTIYEASFGSDNLYAAVDILEQTPAGFCLIEVKSSTSAKEEHLPDVAFQLFVLRQAGLDVSSAQIMHVNRDCTYPDLTNLFIRTDVTDSAGEMLESLPGLAADQLRSLAGTLPDVKIGPHCRKPYECPFISRCWRDLPKHHVSTLYRARNAGFDLVQKGVETINQLPASQKLTAIQKRQQRAILDDDLMVESGLGAALEDFREPIGFLDFETVNPAIPVWDGCHPYDVIPVQFSFHQRSHRGNVTHDEWIADGRGDPRPELARQLLKSCAGVPRLVAYNAPFERRAIEQLADAVPELAGPLTDLASRLIDLLPVIRNHVYHPEFLGSFSLKAVLPALLPGPGYEELDISEGAAASVVLDKLMFHGEGVDPEEKTRLRSALLRYCEFDTMSTMRLLDCLRALSNNDK